LTVPANAQPSGPNYSVKNAETVAAAKDLRVRLFTLAPGQLIPWHFHGAIADEFFVLDGELTMETRAPNDCRALGVGQPIGSMLGMPAKLRIAERMIVGF
jgi:quercetin dioxygenase-like cupin family protein